MTYDRELVTIERVEIGSDFTDPNNIRIILSNGTELAGIRSVNLVLPSPDTIATISLVGYVARLAHIDFGDDDVEPPSPRPS